MPAMSEAEAPAPRPMIRGERVWLRPTEPSDIIHAITAATGLDGESVRNVRLLERLLESERIARGEADMVAFGVPFLANPDLPVRYRSNAALNAPDQATFYAGEEKGYIDYPALA